MNEVILKSSAIHNLIITQRHIKSSREEQISEGLVVPIDILDKSNILPWEQVIITKINGNNWINRLKTFVIPGDEPGKVEIRGSLTNFLNVGDLVCLISMTILNENGLKLYKDNKIPLMDLGFDPSQNDWF